MTSGHLYSWIPVLIRNSCVNFVKSKRILRRNRIKNDYPSFKLFFLQYWNKLIEDNYRITFKAKLLRYQARPVFIFVGLFLALVHETVLHLFLDKLLVMMIMNHDHHQQHSSNINFTESWAFIPINFIQSCYFLQNTRNHDHDHVRQVGP